MKPHKMPHVVNICIRDCVVWEHAVAKTSCRIACRTHASLMKQSLLHHESIRLRWLSAIFFIAFLVALRQNKAWAA